MRKLFFNIRKIWGTENLPATRLVGAEMANVGSIEDAWLLVVDGLIAAYGNGEMPDEDEKIDLAGHELLPGFVDSHTHAVFASERDAEFIMRIKGAGYEEIAAAGGGILNSASRLRAMDFDSLYAKAEENVRKIISHGTTTIEIKSGYGLDLDSELKMLRVIQKLKENLPVTIKSTFLAAHAVPPEFKDNREGYVNHIVEVMLPIVAAEGLADHMDVFCDRGFFTTIDTEKLLTAASKFGLPGKIHANELGLTGGVQVATKMNAWSADHLEHCESDEINALLHSATMPVGLPGTSYFLGIPYTPVRKMIDAGLPVCLASDFNPGSSPLANMQMVWSLGCSQMKLLPEEAFNAITINASRALHLEQQCGSICVSKRADFWTTTLHNAMHTVPYYFGQNHASSVWVRGEKWE